MMKCQSCNGSGINQDEDGPYRCPFCNGTGKFRDEHQAVLNLMTNSMDEAFEYKRVLSDPVCGETGQPIVSCAHCYYNK